MHSFLNVPLTLDLVNFYFYFSNFCCLGVCRGASVEGASFSVEAPLWRAPLASNIYYYRSIVFCPFSSAGSTKSDFNAVGVGGAAKHR